MPPQTSDIAKNRNPLPSVLVATMHVLVFPYVGAPYLRHIGTNLASMQGVVGGTLACLDLPGRYGVDVWYPDDGIALGLPVNPYTRALDLLRELGPLHGTIFLARCTADEGRSVSLNEEDVDFVLERLTKQLVQLTGSVAQGGAL